jgi:hypothetical protein
MQNPISKARPVIFDSFELIAEVYRYRDEVRDLVAENNLLKIRLSEMLEIQSDPRQVEEAESYQSRFMAIEEGLMRLCSRSRRQLSMLLRYETGNPAGQVQMLDRQAALWQKLQELRIGIRETCKEFEARYSG